MYTQRKFSRSHKCSSFEQVLVLAGVAWNNGSCISDLDVFVLFLSVRISKICSYTNPIYTIYTTTTTTTRRRKDENNSYCFWILFKKLECLSIFIQWISLYFPVFLHFNFHHFKLQGLILEKNNFPTYMKHQIWR